MTIGVLEIVAIALIGMAAGTFGGLAGVGGSMIMIPGMALVLGYPGGDGHVEQHLYMAAAMGVNVLLALPAAARHAKEGKLRWDVFRLLLPAMSVTIILGVVLSNLLDGDRLRTIFAGFIILYCGFNLVRVFARETDFDKDQERATRGRVIFTGATAGVISGLLGLGGGVILVPMLQMLCRVRLRPSIATALAVMPLTAIVGAGFKISTLPSHGQLISHAFILIAIIAPLAMIGSHVGAVLTHKLPLKAVRVVILILMVGIALKLLDAY